jgi:hypothetical protein
VPSDPVSALRKECHNLRAELRQYVPGLSEPIPANKSHTDKVLTLDTRVVASDVHEFTELLNVAETLPREHAIEAYEAAIALYRGELLDASDTPTYRWMYDEEPQIALTLRSDLHRRYRDAKLRLAVLLAGGPQQGLDRAEELYMDLCAEEPDNERLWIALFRVYERTGSRLGLDSAVRRLQAALAELDEEPEQVLIKCRCQ